MLCIECLCKSYGDQEVLRDVSLSIDAGQIVAIAGPNGSGKTTLLKCIVGVAKPRSGTIRVGEIDALRNSLGARRLIGYAPSETALYHRLRAGELLDLAIRYHPAADLHRGLSLLDELGVPRERRVEALSHGMKRKVLLAQALASEAPLLILDEPMEAFDPAARRVAVDLLREAAAGGHAVLCSSHDLASTQRLCDRVVFLRDGCVIREGPTGALLAEAGRVVHITLREARTRDELPSHTGWTWTGNGCDWTLVHDESPESVLQWLNALPVASLRIGDASLDEVFAALYEESPS